MLRDLLRRLAFACGLALLVLLGVLLAVLPGRGEERERSVFSTEPDGLRALYLLCEALGFRVEPWNAVPGELTGRGTLLVLFGLPELPPHAGTTETAPRRSRDLAHYRRFLDEGGTLLVPGARAEELDHLRDVLAVPGLDDVASAPARSDARVELEGGEQLELDSGARRRHYRTSAPGEVLARTSDGAALALALPASRGRIVLAGVPRGDLDNRSLAEDGAPALFFVRILEALAPERVLFDEYALGGWQPPSFLALAFRPRFAWLSAHVLLLFALLVWRSAASGPFPRDPEPLLAASPLARARGFGRLLARARRFDLLADLLRRGLLACWEGRAGRRAPAGEDPDPELGLRALARGDERLLARLRALFRARPRDEGELAALAADLGALEGALFPAMDRNAERKRRPTLGARPSSIGS